MVWMILSKLSVKESCSGDIDNWRVCVCVCIHVQEHTTGLLQETRLHSLPKLS